MSTADFVSGNRAFPVDADLAWELPVISGLLTLCVMSAYVLTNSPGSISASLYPVTDILVYPFVVLGAGENLVTWGMARVVCNKISICRHPLRRPNY